jgi:hypothetical protein
MTQVLIIVGVFVFFISVYGAVMVGGHLLEELERAERTPEPAPVAARSADTVAPTTVST